MKKMRDIFVILLVMAMLDIGIIGGLAETPSSPINPGPNEDQYSPSKLAEKDQDFKKVIDILGSDRDYNRLGLTDAQWNDLIKTSVCYPMAWPINHPDVVNAELTLGRPQLPLVLDINAIENTPKGTLIEQLTFNADLNKNLKNLADYAKFFL